MIKQQTREHGYVVKPTDLTHCNRYVNSLCLAGKLLLQARH